MQHVRALARSVVAWAANSGRRGGVPRWVTGLFLVAVVVSCLAVAEALLHAGVALSGTISTAPSPEAQVVAGRTGDTDETISALSRDGASPGGDSPDKAASLSHPIPDPARIVIPAIDVDALVVEVGVAKNGSMELPPFGLAAWFRVGPAPGAPGPAVIIGHVDSPKRPDVFYHLRKLRPGDAILVIDESGDAATFVVDWQETVLKTDLPTERIWAPTSEAVIRLITCGGKWDKKAGHYLSNTIVYGHLVR